MTAERLTELYLARIEAYDKSGPRLNAVLRINPNAKVEARALDAVGCVILGLTNMVGSFRSPCHWIRLARGRARRRSGDCAQRDGRAGSASAAVVATDITDYTAALKPTSLKGARLGLIRTYMGQDAAADAVIESALSVLRAQGAEIVDVTLPAYVPGFAGSVYVTICDTEFRYQIEDYLARHCRARTCQRRMWTSFGSAKL